MTSNHHALMTLGYTRTTMGVNRRKRDREMEHNPRNTLSVPDRRPQLAYVKSESLVIAGQHTAVVNTFLGLVQPPVTPRKLKCPKPVGNLREPAVLGKAR